MAVVGRACLILALAVAVYGIGASLYGARARRRGWAESGRRAVYAVAFLTTVAFAILEAAFLRSDFSFATVQLHSSTTTPTFYKGAAAWSSQEGSLLLWLFLLSMWSSLVLFLTRRRLRDVAPYAQAVLLTFAAFFAGLLVFAATPFATLATAPSEGAGLQPLLRHPSMMIHPPMLYSGYTLFTIPFAFAVGALIVRRVDAEWISATRRFALAAWFFLGIGILLGARWSYSELGWGGYWAWDPVENASLMPWLTGTAFLHSIMVQERRGMLKTWNASLVLATGTLAIMGTFLVRSGILDSIHAFGGSTLGVPFVTLIGVLIVGSIALVVSRRDTLRTENHIDSLLSREAVFIGNNLVLLGLCFVVFWGTFFPLISEAVTGDKAAVGPPWFDRYTVPLALLLILLSGIGPVVAWRRVAPKTARRSFTVPAAVAAVAAAALAFAGTASQPWAYGMFVIGAFSIAVVGQEIARGVRARRAMAGGSVPAAFVTLFARNRRRHGGYVVHLGMAILFVGVAASSAFQHARDVSLAKGQTARVGGYDIRYVRPTAEVLHDSAHTGALITLGAVLDVRKDGRHFATLHPARDYYPSTDIAQFGPVERFIEGEPTSEVAMKSGLRRDLWTAMSLDVTPLAKALVFANQKFARADLTLQFTAAAGAAEGLHMRGGLPATFRVIVSPLVMWIWIGGLVVFLGGLICLWPAPDTLRRRARAGAAAQVARDLGRA